jgi:hypothetical protein
MRFDGEGRCELDLLRSRASRKLAEIHKMLAPDLREPFTAAELLETAESRFAQLAAPEKDKLRMRVIVAYAELEQLTARMAKCLNEIQDELHKIQLLSRVHAAYRRAPRLVGPSVSRGRPGEPL